MTTLETLLQETERIFAALSAPIAPNVFRDNVRNLADQVSLLSDKAMADKINSALAAVHWWDYADSGNWVMMKYVIRPRIETLVEVIRQESSAVGDRPAKGRRVLQRSLKSAFVASYSCPA